MRSVSSRVRRPRKLHPGRALRGRRQALELGPLGAVSDDDELRGRHAGDRLDRDAEGLLPREPADEDERARLELLGLDLGGRRRRVREDEDPRVREPPPSRDLGEVRARDDDRRRRAEGARPGGLERADRRARRALELLERALEQAVAARALVGGVGDELRDERAPRGGRRGCGGGVRRRRVDDVGRAGRPRSPQRHLAVAEREREPARDDLDLAGPLRRLAVTHRHDPDASGRARRGTERSPARASQGRQRPAARFL